MKEEEETNANEFEYNLEDEGDDRNICQMNLDTFRENILYRKINKTSNRAYSQYATMEEAFEKLYSRDD